MRYRHLALLLLVLAACGTDAAKKTASVGEALPGLPLPPEARVMSRSGTPQALQITFQSLWAADSIAWYYRQILSTGEWTLQSDVMDATGAAVLYATRDGPPIWVRVWPTVGAPGSTLTITGAAVPAKPAAKAPTGS